MRSDQLVRVATISLAVSGTLVGLFVLWQLRLPVVLCFLAFGVSAAIEPAIRQLIAVNLPKWAAMAIAYFGLAAVIVAIPMAVAQPLGIEVAQLAKDFSSATTAEPTQNAGRLQQLLALTLPQVKSFAQDTFGRDVSGTLWQVFGFTWGAFEVLGNLVVVFVLSIYWSGDHERFERLWLSLLSVGKRGPARDVWETVQTEIGGYLRSEAVQCLAAGLLLGIGYQALGFPYPIVLAVIGAIAWLVPWGGVLIAAVATLLLSIPAILNQGDHVLGTLALPAVLYTVVVVALLEHFIEPRFFDRHRYNSLLVLLVVIVFTELFGFTGLLLAPPTAAALQIVAGYFLRLRSLSIATTANPSPFDERLDELWQIADNTPDASPEVVSLLERLTRLASDVRLESKSA